MHPNRRNAETDGPSAESLVFVCVLEDSQRFRSEMKQKLQEYDFLVLGASSIDECLGYLHEGCRTFILDVVLDPEDPVLQVGGLHALQQIKEEEPQAFCAVVTNHPDAEKHRAMAHSLRADWFSTKDRDQVEGLIQRLLDLFNERAAPALRQRLKRELEFDAHSRFHDVLEVLDAAEALVDLDPSAAEIELVRAEPALSELIDAHVKIGGGTAMVASALLNCVKNEPGNRLTRAKLQALLEVTRQCAESMPVSQPDASSYIERLEDAGLNPEPPDYSTVTGLFGA